MKTFIYSKISTLNGVHEICTQYALKQIDFAVIFTDAKAIKTIQKRFILPLVQSEPLVGFRLFKFVRIYNSVWALSDEMKNCSLDLQLSEDKKQLTVWFRWKT